MRKSGRIDWFDEKKGFGWITLSDGVRVYLHGSALAAGFRPANGASVDFELLEGPSGCCAVDVRALDAGPVKHRSRGL